MLVNTNRTEIIITDLQEIRKKVRSHRPTRHSAQYSLQLNGTNRDAIALKRVNGSYMYMGMFFYFPERHAFFGGHIPAFAENSSSVCLLKFCMYLMSIYFISLSLNRLDSTYMFFKLLCDDTVDDLIVVCFMTVRRSKEVLVRTTQY